MSDTKIVSNQPNKNYSRKTLSLLKKKLLVLFASLVLLTASPLLYSRDVLPIPPDKVIDIAFREGYTDFPTAVDIIAIAWIESNFNPSAVNGVSRGIMQVNHGPMDLEENMVTGIKMLRNLFLRLGNARAAIEAYNIGIGNYLKNRYRISGGKYFKKYLKHRDYYEQKYLQGNFQE